MKIQILAIFTLLAFISCTEKKEKEDKPEEDKKEIVKEQKEKTEEVISKEVSQPEVEQETESEQIIEKPFSILGKHMLSLQWIKSDKLGMVEIKDMGGAIMVRGEHLSSEHPGDYLKIEGSLITASETELVMDATIKTKVYHLNNGEECIKEGRFTFLVTKGRKFWRNQDMKNSCEDVTDYVDIYFK